ncbi:alpha/beta hydrolase fold protein [Gloeothece citriformis PCC 7424]|uniref:Alpha/beta hydrolase fold protein n=1 Tax=Gloeothece citriformis (strain PCC 7424) TaxID=65393 RepID=B7KI60_GLOC7|nr:alpha/beta hydrolase [Gloeothece citriformis]ACK73547.1 alpha/beta hydrolase fold protein [Gloeothece citriformis PCC 7424]
MNLLQEGWRNGFIKTNGINLHYVTAGEGKLMLMLHGFPEFWYSWRHQIPEFSQDHKVVALDLRGYNDSDKPQSQDAYKLQEIVADIEGVITALGYDNCILVGHDWGGAIAWQFAYTYPNKVEKLIILNLPHPAKFSEGIRNPQQLMKSWYAFFFQTPFFPEWILQANDYQLIESGFKMMAVDKNIFTQKDLNAYKDAAAKRGALTGMLNYYRSTAQGLMTRSPKDWGILEVPTLMIWGEDDAALGKELTYGTEVYVKDFTIKYIPNCSHWVQQERPQLVNQYIREFLRSF